MSLDLDLYHEASGFSAEFNITHNLTDMAAAAGLTDMADAAGLYQPLWRGLIVEGDTTRQVTCARDLIGPILDGLRAMFADPDRFRKLNPPNGWGSYDGFVTWLAKVLAACCECPQASVSICR